MSLRRRPRQAGFAPADDLPALLAEKLASSGLTIADGARLRMTALSAAEANALCPSAHPMPSLRIPYYDPAGRPSRAAPGWPEFFRLRALRLPVPLPEGFPKYVQPADSGVCAYFPVGPDWSAILGDHTRQLLITEGELKAAKATKDGFPTIALGGVDSYQSKALGERLIPDLEAVAWERRDAVICYDSDAARNEHVCGALRRLADLLRDRGAKVRVLILPEGEEGKKVGLDDFLLARPADDLRYLLADVTAARPITLARRLWATNDAYAYVRELDEVVDARTGLPYRLETFRHWFTESVVKNTVTDAGLVVPKAVSLGDDWLRWPMRRAVARLAYEPGKRTLGVVAGRGGDDEFNTWTGWGVEPKEGDVSPFLDLCRCLFVEPGAVDWVLDWSAYPLQHPGAKLTTAVVIFSLFQGIGKTEFFRTLGAIHGAENYSVIDQKLLVDGKFNEWARGKTFILADDISGTTDKRETHDMAKLRVTQERVRVEIKNQTAYTLRDTINWGFTTNNPAAFRLEEHDRRFYIVEVPKSAFFSEEWFTRYRGWVAGGGAAAIFAWMLKRDLSRFAPHGRAPMTEGKVRMTDLARSDVDRWVADLVAHPGDVLRLPGGAPVPGDLVTFDLLRSLCAGAIGANEDRVRTPLYTALKAAGLAQVNKGLPVRRKGEPLARYYAVRDVARWASAPLLEVHRHLDDPAAESPGAAPPRPGVTPIGAGKARKKKY